MKGNIIIDLIQSEYCDSFNTCNNVKLYLSNQPERSTNSYLFTTEYHHFYLYTTNVYNRLFSAQRPSRLTHTYLAILQLPQAFSLMHKTHCITLFHPFRVAPLVHASTCVSPTYNRETFHSLFARARMHATKLCCCSLSLSAFSPICKTSPSLLAQTNSSL